MVRTDVREPMINRRHNLTFWAATLLLSLAAALQVRGEEIMQCPDMSAHMKVLKEGQEVDQSHPKESTSRGSSWRDFDNSYDSHDYDLPREPLSEKECDALSLSNGRDIYDAGLHADTYVDVGNYKAAEKLYKRMIEADSSRVSPKSVELAELLENLAAVEILMDSPPQKFEPRLSSHVRFRLLSEPVPSSLSLMASARLHVLDAVKVVSTGSGELKLSEENHLHWQAAMKNYQRALDIRKSNSTTDVDLSCSILELAALEEWRHHLSAAAKLYQSALELEPRDSQTYGNWSSIHGHMSSFPTGSAAFVDFCIRNNRWLDVHQNEPDLIKIAAVQKDTEALTTLISAYNDHGQSDDAVRMFKVILSLTQKENFNHVAMPSSTVVPLLDHITPEVLALLTKYLADIESQWSKVNREDYLTWMPADSEFSKEMATSLAKQESNQNAMVMAIEKHGWISSAETIYLAGVQEPLSEHHVPSLIRLAQFYERQNNYDKAGVQYERAMKVIEAKYPSSDGFERKIHSLSLLISGMSDSLCARNTVCKSARERAKRLQVTYEQEAQKRQCLEIAKKLNCTAGGLENKELYPAATKLYKEALDIKLQKLGAKDPDTAAQYADLARVAAKQKHYGEAQSLYDQAFAIYRPQKERALRDYGVLLEEYAQFLEQVNKPKESQLAYDEARDTFRKVSEQQKH